MKYLLNFLRIGVVLGLGVLPISSTIIGKPVHKFGVALVESDLAAVASNFTQYDADLHSFFQQGEPLAQGLELHNLGETAFTALNSTITDVTALGSVSTAVASTIEKSVASIEATLIDICQTISNNIDDTTPAARALSAFQPSDPIILREPAVPSPIALLRLDLTNFQTAFEELLNALQVVVPASIATEFASLESQFLSQCPST